MKLKQFDFKFSLKIFILDSPDLKTMYFRKTCMSIRFQMYSSQTICILVYMYSSICILSQLQHSYQYSLISAKFVPNMLFWSTLYTGNDILYKTVYIFKYKQLQRLKQHKIRNKLSDTFGVSKTVNIITTGFYQRRAFWFRI